MRVWIRLSLLAASAACALFGGGAPAQERPDIRQSTLAPPTVAKKLSLDRCRRVLAKGKASAAFAIEFKPQIDDCKKRYSKLGRPNLPPLPGVRIDEIAKNPPQSDGKIIT